MTLPPALAVRSVNCPILRFNLNIPRYVDTFEEEEPVDLGAVKSKIQTLDCETKAAIDKAESFMRQLGL